MPLIGYDLCYGWNYRLNKCWMMISCLLMHEVACAEIYMPMNKTNSIKADSTSEFYVFIGGWGKVDIEIS